MTDPKTPAPKSRPADESVEVAALREVPTHDGVHPVDVVQVPSIDKHGQPDQTKGFIQLSDDDREGVPDRLGVKPPAEWGVEDDAADRKV